MNELIPLLPKLVQATGETLYIVALSLLFGGLGGLLIGLGLALTRGGALYANRVVYGLLNVIVNVFRPIPFIIFIAAAQPLARLVVGSGIGTDAIVFTLSLGAAFGIGRIVEQNLLTVQPGVIEAARSVGASRFRIVRTVLLPEALGPLILGYTFVFVAVIDMSAVAGYIGAGGLGNFAIQYGYRQFEPVVTWAAVLVIIVIVQLVQLLGNVLARRVLRR
ncbi:ABC transporter permease [Rathayibacter sp. AY1G1]|jgi:D-methionine transport system permease protein|uniref:methionine ABC transporter permease n=1 Tax=unclassified Rathayibacter TaxID=2609250 RepID=UPI000CE92F32|nr:MULTISPECIES: methionine ABC transporter permease [unclassified Rathayibacter]PPF34222.1 ABC transporter permease [Rathayibacter sp. AY1A2]PPG10256.1 ABC transporter permease [Rathayibacter sp. AY2B1]PPG64583.1 ABC transporter permease [Rathayibacter sp. AY2B7]PPG73975.1 ABC transporter permease [Rathayibacter sp. AY1F4]PPH08143.1 ABC transporter permease [Rathayibacter sp. AY1H3]